MKEEDAEKELMKSLSFSYDLYNYMLMLMLEIHKVAEKALEIQENRAKRLHRDEEFNQRFVCNRFMLQLASNKQLLAFAKNMRFTWTEHDELVRAIFAQIEASEFFQEYMEKGECTYADDRNVCRQIYKTFICNNEKIDDILEEVSLYWNDDKPIVDTFVLKTINKFTEKSDAEQPLLPEFKDQEDQDFAIRLLRRTLGNIEYYKELISETTRRWELNRIALMDRIILMIALAEITTFPSIPVNVSINEYIELAKMYGSNTSPSYINGTLDAIVHKLKNENKLIKDEPLEKKSKKDTKENKD